MITMAPWSRTIDRSEVRNTKKPVESRRRDSGSLCKFKNGFDRGIVLPLKDARYGGSPKHRVRTARCSVPSGLILSFDEYFNQGDGLIIEETGWQ